uniref:Secreted protein n=1 Tax=Anopheles dirus TaxID=7168 RepID=A0A182NNY5_9DIPT
MNLRSEPLRLAAVWALFMSLQMAGATPFFGVSVQGGFQTEADVAVSARAVGLAVQSSQQAMVSFTEKLPLSTGTHNRTAGAVLQLYGIVVSNIVTLTDAISWAAVNTTNTPTDVFAALETAFTKAFVVLQSDASKPIASIAAYSPGNGSLLGASWDTILLILADIRSTLAAFNRTIVTLPSPVTAKQVFEKLTKSQIATIIGALDALRIQVTVVTGKLKETATLLTDADTLMSSYISMLAQAFSNVDYSLSSMFNSLTARSADFFKQFRASGPAVSSEWLTFFNKIKYFKDDAIAVAANDIQTATYALVSKHLEAIAILEPNIDERLQLLVSTATDTVLEAAQNLLFTTYRVLDSAMRRIPTVPSSRGKSCATDFISPYVQYLSSNMAPCLTGCIAWTAAQSDTVLQGQLRSIDALVRDRKAYINMWNNAINGITNTTVLYSRSLAVAKLLTQTSTHEQDTLQPALASAFSYYAQLVSNLEAVLNRAKLCVTVKSAELSAQLIMASINFNTCIDS